MASNPERTPEGMLAALRESEEKWRTLVQCAPDVVMTVDRDYRITFVNHVTAGHTPEEVLGKSVLNYTLADHRAVLQAALDDIFDRGRTDTFEFPGIRLDGTQGWYVCRMGPVRRESQIDSAIILCTDVTDRKAVEQDLLKEQQLLKQLLEFQERERKLAAFEIHDGLAQYVTGALMHVEACRAAQPPTGKAEQEMERAVALLREAVAESRRLISGLRPPVLDESGILPALEFLINETRREIPQFDFEPPKGLPRLNSQLESAIFRIVQEALTNIRRHSHTERAHLRFTVEGSRLRLEIRDWGVGFDLKQVREGSFGLQGIRERARLLGGSATIHAVPGDGTTLSIELPLLVKQ